MIDRVQVKRLAAKWTRSVVQADVQVEQEARSEEVRYQLWASGIEAEQLGILARCEVLLDSDLALTMIAVTVGHIVEIRDGDNVATEIVGAVSHDPSAPPLVDQEIAPTSAQRRYEVSGLAVRTATRMVDFTPGRARWLAGIVADPALRGRMVAIGLNSDPTQVRMIVYAIPGSTRFAAAHLFPQEAKLVLTETSVSRC